jgi:DNA replication and repair protein RecF
LFISSLRTTAFRNLADAEIDTGGKNVFLVGRNGQGKTNFLEAFYFSSYASSFRGARDGELARTDGKDFSASVKLEDSACSLVLIKYEGGKKSIYIDGKRISDRKELLELIPCIVFCHEDMEFVAGTPERRRWFFDQCLSLYDPVYLDDLRRYRHILKARNALLRDNGTGRLSPDSGAMLDALDTQLAGIGLNLMEKRENAAEIFSGLFGPLYEEVSGIGGIAVRYAPSWKTKNAGTVCDHLREKREAEFAAGLTLSGPHRDRYLFLCFDGEFAGKASTGQRRLLALLLRIAQARRFFDMTGKRPVLLLDDVLLEMDGEKRRRFLSVMPEYDQAFFTFLPEEPYEAYKIEGTLVYRVSEGTLSKI